MLAASTVMPSGSDGSEPGLSTMEERSKSGQGESSERLNGDAPWQEQKVAAADDIVDWDGPDDPNNPLNWPESQRLAHVIIVAVLSMVV
jgi:hypothetical protein